MLGRGVCTDALGNVRSLVSGAPFSSVDRAEIRSVRTFTPYSSFIETKLVSNLSRKLDGFSSKKWLKLTDSVISFEQ